MLDTGIVLNSIEIVHECLHCILAYYLIHLEHSLRCASHLTFYFTKGQHCEQTVHRRYHSRQVGLPRAEISSHHVTYHVSQLKVLHIFVVDYYKCGPLHQNAKVIDKVPSLYNLFPPNTVGY